MKRDTDFNSQPPEYVKRWYREFIFGYLEPDGIFMLRLLSSNTSDFVCTEVNPPAARSQPIHVSHSGHQPTLARLLHQGSETAETQTQIGSAGRRTRNSGNPPSSLGSGRSLSDLRFDSSSKCADASGPTCIERRHGVGKVNERLRTSDGDESTLSLVADRCRKTFVPVNFSRRRCLTFRRNI